MNKRTNKLIDIDRIKDLTIEQASKLKGVLDYYEGVGAIEELDDFDKIYSELDKKFKGKFLEKHRFPELETVQKIQKNSNNIFKLNNEEIKTPKVKSTVNTDNSLMDKYYQAKDKTDRIDPARYEWPYLTKGETTKVYDFKGMSPEERDFRYSLFDKRRAAEKIPHSGRVFDKVPSVPNEFMHKLPPLPEEIIENIPKVKSLNAPNKMLKKLPILGGLIAGVSALSNGDVNAAIPILQEADNLGPEKGTLDYKFESGEKLTPEEIEELKSFSRFQELKNKLKE